MIQAVFLLGLIFQCGASNEITCDRGWEKFQESCYAFELEAVNWLTAGAACMHYDSNLVQINNAEENAYLAATLAATSFGPAWIGASDRHHEGVFEWVPSMKVLTYQSWSAGKPNISNHKENCVELRQDYAWNDIDCAAKNRFICEKRPRFVMC